MVSLPSFIDKIRHIWGISFKVLVNNALNYVNVNKKDKYIILYLIQRYNIFGYNCSVYYIQI